MKRAQIKMFETIGVLIIFFFLLVVGASFYFSIQGSSLQAQLDKKADLDALQTVTKILSLPELDCSFVSVQKQNCLDSLKMSAFASLVKSPSALADYFKVFGFATIQVRPVYPSGNAVVLYNNTVKYKKMIATQSPILIYNPSENSYSFGAIEVKSYVE